MRIIISNSSPVPIYQQIKDNIIDQILSNEIKENESLPSIRNLAKDIKISVMTIKKAYDELEKEGYIMSVQGKGTFVSPKSLELTKENAQKEIESNLIKAIDIAKEFNIDKKDIFDIIDIFYGRDN